MAPSLGEISWTLLLQVCVLVGAAARSAVAPGGSALSCPGAYNHLPRAGRVDVTALNFHWRGYDPLSGLRTEVRLTLQRPCRRLFAKQQANWGQQPWQQRAGSRLQRCGAGAEARGGAVPWPVPTEPLWQRRAGAAPVPTEPLARATGGQAPGPVPTELRATGAVFCPVPGCSGSHQASATGRPPQ